MNSSPTAPYACCPHQTLTTVPYRWTISVLLALAFTVYFVATAWLGDDIFITLRSVEQFADGNGIRWNPHERVQVFTHPLWFGLLVATRVITPHLVWGVFGLSFLASLIMVLYHFQISRLLGISGGLVLALLFSSRAWTDYLSSGLETPLTGLLLLTFLHRWWLFVANPEKHWTWLVAFASLVALNRFDLIVLIFPTFVAALYLYWQSEGRKTRRIFSGLAWGSIPFLSWALFSTFYFGFLLPNTAYAKLATAIPSHELWSQGFRYLLHFLIWDPFGFAIVGSGLVMGLKLRGVWGPPALGVLAYLLYVVRVGGDFMAGRFMVPLIPIAALLLAVGLGRYRLQRQAFFIAGLVFVIFPFSPLKQLGAKDYGSHYQWGVADERSAYSRRLSLWRYWNDPPPKRGAEDKISRAKKIGQFGFHSRHDRILVDLYGLGDPLLARLGALRPWRIGHFERRLPAGYLASLSSGNNLIENPKVRQLYEDLRLITQGPLWSQARFRAIARMNLTRPTLPCSEPPCRALEIQVVAPEGFSKWPHKEAGEIRSIRREGRRLVITGRLPLEDDELQQKVFLAVPTLPIGQSLEAIFPGSESPDDTQTQGRFRLTARFAHRREARRALRAACVGVESASTPPRLLRSPLETCSVRPAPRAPDKRGGPS